jgi:hypothetical protein
MGYDAFFLQYPAFHQKFVIAMVKESAPAPAAPTAPVLDIPWLTNNRFAYKRETPALELIDNAKIVEPPKG